MKQTSILNEKCECGKKIDYFELQEKAIKETQKYRIIFNKIFMIALAILIILVSIIITNINVSEQGMNEYDKGMETGMWLVINIGLLYLILIIHTNNNKARRFNAKKRRKSFRNSRRAKLYWNKLNKKQKRIVVGGMLFPALIYLIPMLSIAWLIINYKLTGIINEYANGDPYIPIAIVLLLIVVLIFIFHLTNKQQTNYIKYFYNRQRKNIIKKHRIDIDRIYCPSKYHRRDKSNGR